MKRVVIRLLAAIGLVTARRYDALALQARQSSRDAASWKKQAAKSKSKLGELERQLAEQARRVKEARANVDRKAVAVERTLEEWTAMQARLADAEQALAIARDQLMTVEVKLDILEGAANVLDARTRTTPQGRYR